MPYPRASPGTEQALRVARVDFAAGRIHSDPVCLPCLFFDTADTRSANLTSGHRTRLQKNKPEGSVALPACRRGDVVLPAPSLPYQRGAPDPNTVTQFVLEPAGFRGSRTKTQTARTAMAGLDTRGDAKLFLVVCRPGKKWGLTKGHFLEQNG